MNREKECISPSMFYQNKLREELALKNRSNEQSKQEAGLSTKENPSFTETIQLRRNDNSFASTKER